MKKKLLSLLLATSMVVALTACGAQNDTVAVTEEEVVAVEEEVAEEAAEAAAEGIDLSEQVDLVFYVMGDAPQDEAMVEDAINKILLEKCNATIDMQFSTWTDFQQKYSLEITSQNADLIYIANWLNYGQLANSGAFLELDELLDTVAPTLKATVGDAALNQTSVNGKIYAVPNTWAEYTSNGIKYREDLRVKYDLPVPDSLENLEAYLLGIKENEPSQGILTVTTEESQGLQTAFDAAWALNLKYPWVFVKGLT